MKYDLKTRALISVFLAQYPNLTVSEFAKMIKIAS